MQETRVLLPDDEVFESLNDIVIVPIVPPKTKTLDAQRDDARRQIENAKSTRNEFLRLLASSDRQIQQKERELSSLQAELNRLQDQKDQFRARLDAILHTISRLSEDPILHSAVGGRRMMRRASYY
jgi:septal ring factor EnvC (AmiA/AmiB activator)